MSHPMNYAEKVMEYSKEELLEVLSSIDRDKFPDRYLAAKRRYDEIKDDPAFNRIDPMEKYQTGVRRFWAMALDGFIIQLISILLFVSFGSIFGSKESGDFEFYLSPVYMVWLTTVFGATLGKYICRLKVLSYPDENAIGFRAALLREIFPVTLVLISLPISIASGFSEIEIPLWLTIASGAILALGSLGWLVLEIVTMMRDPKRRAFHDKIAGTVVVKRR